MIEIACANGTRVVIGPSWAVTTLPGGAEVHAHPDGSWRQAETAARLGYADVGAMTRDHDALHSILADLVGAPASFSLRQAAGQLPAAEDHIAAREEAAVLALQAYLQAAGLPLPQPR